VKHPTPNALNVLIGREKVCIHRKLVD